jgi:chemotaxis protein CheC
MGRAGKSLAEAFGTFIHLSIPTIQFLSSSEITECLISHIGKNVEISAVRQAFNGTITGESFLIFDKQDYTKLSALLDHNDELTPEAEDEMLLDISNILIGAFHSCISDVMSIDVSVSPSVLMAKSIEIGNLKLADPKIQGQFIMIEIIFQIDQEGACCHLAQLLPNQSIETLKSALDCFIAAY